MKWKPRFTWEEKQKYNEYANGKDFKPNLNFQKAIRNLMEKEKLIAEMKEELKKNNQNPNQAKLDKDQIRSLLFYVYKIKHNAEQYHYIERVALLLNTEPLKIKQMANEYDRYKHDQYMKKRGADKHAKDHL